MDDPFPLDAVRTMVRQTLASHCRHRDFEDIVQEAVLAAWLASQRHPELSVAILARQNARWQLYEWFRSAKCGDLSGNYRQAHILVQPFADWLEGSLAEEHGDITALIHRRLVWQDFVAGLKPHYRRAFYLIYREGVPVYKAAKAVGISNPALREGLELAYRKYREKPHA
jgi:DNA-directed RNA polymerase specialized sigma24 family protein